MSLKSTIQGLSMEGAQLTGGVVVGVSPIRIQLYNDSKVVLGGQSLCVPAEFGSRAVKLTVDSETKDALIDNSLKSGERVYLLCLPGSKKYIVIGRM